MNWENPTYSFGNPNAQPPTPTQTPTSTLFPSPTLQTPRGNIHSFEHHSGWTPKFAEEYSVFNATPGRLINNQGTFPDITTPRPSTASSIKRPYSSTEDLRADPALYGGRPPTHPHHPLPPVDPSQQLASTPGPVPLHGKQAHDAKSQTTPQNPRSRLEEAFRGQIATPPQSVSKEQRKLAPKFDLDNMQRDQEAYFNTSGTPIQSNLLTIAPVTGDVFSYPMSAPATAPVFTNVKPFWDPESNMAGMDIAYSGGDPSMFGSTPNHRVVNSYDWGRANQAFQENINLQPFDNMNSPSLRRQRPLISKPTVSNSAQMMTDPAYNFHMSTMAEDPFSMVSSSGSVDPGLLFTLPELPPSSTHTAMGNISAPMPQPASTQFAREPYLHQQRESLRDLEELRRARSTRESNLAAKYDRAAFSSPARSSRPGLRRSVSDRQPRTLQAQRLSQPLNLGPRPTNVATDIRGIPNKGRVSPLKQQNRPGLASIPEALGGNTRASVSFSIDANGRARTETKIITDGATLTKPGSQQTQEDEWESPRSGSSTDDDPILIPSRNTSFVLPNPKDGALTGYESSRQSTESRGSSNNKRDTSSFLEEESEAETVMMDDDGSGDATDALRKVMESRKRSNSGRVRSIRRHHHSRDASGGSQERATPQQRFQYNPSSTDISPTTVTDPDLETPSTDRGSSFSDSTRCICNSRNGDGFMIQCESCEKWLHGKCVGVSRHRLPQVYICAFCAQTPNMRGGRIRETTRGNTQLGSSPLAHKSFTSWR